MKTETHWNEDDTRIIRLLDDARHRSGLSVHTLAALAGMSYGRLRDMLACHKGAPLWHEVLAVAGALGLEWEDLIPGKESAGVLASVDDGVLLGEVARRLEAARHKSDVEDAQVVVRRFEAGDLTIAANRDPLKNVEASGGEGR